VPHMSGGVHHSLAVEWFREAQNQELDGNVSAASRLYERTLSLRQHAHATTATVPTTAVSSTRPAAPHWHGNTWSMVLFFLDLNELWCVASCSKTFRAWCERHRAVEGALYNKRHPLHHGLLDSISQVRSAERGHWYYATSEPRIQRQIEAHMPDYLPRFQSRHGSLCVFVYTKAVFDSNPITCLRVLALAALCQFGVSNKSRTYVAQYDAERNRALACSVRELLDAAFHERPLAGAWYHLQQSSEADLTQQRHAPSASTVNPSPREALRKSVDPRIIAPRGTECEAQHVVGFEAHLERGGDKYAATLAAAYEHLTGYIALTQRTTSLYKYNRCDHNRDGRGSCAHDDEWLSVDKPVYYNNLIADFSLARVQVEEADDSPWECSCCQELVQPHARRFWVANLEPLSVSSFQHAACQWRTGTKQPGTQSYTRSFDSQRALHHMHIFQMDAAEGVDGVELEQESGSEVYDDNERRESDDELVQRAQVDLGKMVAPSSVEDDHIFVSQYAAIHVM
jgi:hypothetical protein